MFHTGDQAVVLAIDLLPDDTCFYYNPFCKLQNDYVYRLCFLTKHPIELYPATKSKLTNKEFVIFQSFVDHEKEKEYTNQFPPNNSLNSALPSCFISRIYLVTVRKEGLVKEMNHDKVNEKFTTCLQEEIKSNSRFL